MTWLEEVVAHRGSPKVDLTDVQLGDRSRSCWVWFLNERNHSVTIDRFTAREWRAAANAPGRSAIWTGDTEPADAQMRTLCATVGLIPLGGPLTCEAIVAGLEALAGDPDRVAEWLASHGMRGELAPSPPDLLLAVAADLAAGRLPGTVNAGAVTA